MYKGYTIRKEPHEVVRFLTTLHSLGKQISEEYKPSSHKIEKAYIDWGPMQWTLQHRIMLVSQALAKELYLQEKSVEQHTYQWTLQFFSNGEMELEYSKDSSKSFKRRLR